VGELFSLRRATRRHDQAAIRRARERRHGDFARRLVAMRRCPVLMMAEGDSTVLSRFP
jgi:hypothetical protein